MQDDVERVARALCRQAIGYCERWDLDKRVDDEWGCWIPQARAAMVATREIDAEAVRKLAATSPYVADCDNDRRTKLLNITADWLRDRADKLKEPSNG